MYKIPCVIQSKRIKIMLMKEKKGEGDRELPV